MKYDFKGWATRYNVLCSDGRTILPGAFKDQDGAKVPLVYAHIHDDPMAVLGYAVLEHRDEGVYTYGCFNDSEQGRNAKLLVEHGDIDSVSICANKLEPKRSNEVRHGKIRELSLVLAGANEGAHIEPILAHSDDGEDEVTGLYVYNDEYIELNHDDEDIPENLEHEEKGASEMADEKTTETKEESEATAETVMDVINGMSEKEQAIVYGLVMEAMQMDPEEDNEEESEEMKHNIFDTEEKISGTCLNHDAFEAIKANAKRLGSMKEAYEDYLADTLQHEDSEPVEYTDRNGDVITYNRDGNGVPYGVGNWEYAYPDPKLVGDMPQVIDRDQTWVAKVLNGAKHSPFARIKTIVADITEDEARAKGYIKGKYKKEEFFSLMKRSTTPTTIYKKQKMDRDDIIDMTEWSVVAWLKQEMGGKLDEEKARAMLIGDGRLPSDDDHIDPTCIRPIAYDADLYTVKVTLPELDDETSTGSSARDFIRAVIANRKLYKGSGNPTLFTTEDMLTEMLLLTDEIGRDLYESEAKLATKLRVKEIVTVPVLENNEDLIVGILVNMADYTVGADKGGARSMFEDFDIDYNQQKYLIEERMSGALTKPYSAMVFKKAAESSNETVGDIDP